MLLLLLAAEAWSIHHKPTQRRPWRKFNEEQARHAEAPGLAWHGLDRFLDFSIGYPLTGRLYYSHHACLSSQIMGPKFSDNQ